jgi:hypothetical protein
MNSEWVRQVKPEACRKFIRDGWELRVYDEQPDLLEVLAPGDIEVSLEDDGLICFAAATDGHKWVPIDCIIPWPILTEIVKFKLHTTAIAAEVKP